jgi:hypothetical protein
MGLSLREIDLSYWWIKYNKLKIFEKRKILMKNKETNLTGISSLLLK